MPPYAWIALALALVFSLVGAGRAGLLGWRLWRELRGFTRAVGAAVDGLATSAASTADHAAGVADRAERLTADVARLRSSLARLALLRAAAGEAGELFAGLRAAAPRK